jgi:hypothetical protein
MLSWRSFKNFRNIFAILYHLYEFLRNFQKYFQVDLCVPPIILEKITKIILKILCSILYHVLESDEKFNMSYEKHSNFYLESIT